VGEDQMPHLELTREMARRFNHHFPKEDGNVFPEPEGLVTKFARFPGTDGKRMSKSLGNTIEISANPDEIREKIKPAYTDPQRLRRSDPGDPEVCAVYTWYRKFLPDEVEETAAECRSAARGCVDCKKRLAEGVIEHFTPLREKGPNTKPCRRGWTRSSPMAVTGPDWWPARPWTESTKQWASVRRTL
jgi:tryptophanyl-tRNA synthetase